MRISFQYCSAYQNNDINEFEKILKTNRQNIMEDPFIREHIEGILFFTCRDKYWYFLKCKLIVFEMEIIKTTNKKNIQKCI